MTTRIRDAALAALFLGAIMTFGDFVWATWHVQHRVAYGVVHGAVMCLCIGAVIGLRARRVAAGALAGPIIGVAAAALFYLLAPQLRWSAMLPAWMLFWILFALLQHKLAGHEPARRAIIRGLAAAVLSGVAFYAISGDCATKYATSAVIARPAAIQPYTERRKAVTRSSAA